MLEAAQPIAQALAPLLPYLVTGGDEAVREATRRFGGAVIERARGLWDRVRGSAPEPERLDAAAADAAAAPQDPDALAALRLQVRRALEAAPHMAQLWQQEAEAILQATGSARGGDRSVVNTGIIRDSTIITGEGNRVEQPARRGDGRGERP